MITDNSSTKLRDIVLEVNEVLGLLMCHDIIKVYILIAPFEVVNNALVRQLLLDDEDVLEEFDDSLLYVKMIKLCNHGLLIFEVLFVLVNEGISFIDDVPNIIKHRAIIADVQR